jgi:hypothetical protein
MIQPDDKLVLEAVRGNGAAGTPNANRADRDLAAIRLNPNGSRDQSFGTNGVASIGAVFQENGQTIQAVENPRQGGGALQIDPGGTADWYYGSTLLSSGKVAVARYKGGVPSTGDDAAIARFDVGFVPVPAAAVVGIGRLAKLRRGPSTLTGTVTPAAGVGKVLVPLTKGSGAACRAFNLAKQAFTGMSCLANKGFAAVVDKGMWTVYLGTALPKGKYALEAVAVTPSGRKQTVTAGANLIRFDVAG